MKRILVLLLTALLLCSALASCTLDDPTDTADSTDSTAEDASAEDTSAEDTSAEDTEQPVEEKKPYEEPLVVEYEDFTVSMEAPIVVFQGNEGDDAWGHTNFPSVSRTKEGYLRVSWLYGDDVVGAKNNVSYVKVSVNEGKSWLPLNVNNSSAAPTKVMANGKCWGGFVSAGTPTSKEMAQLIPDSEKYKLDDGRFLLFAEDLEKYDLATELQLYSLSMREYDPETGTYETFPCTLNWPYASVVLYASNLFYTTSGYFGLSNNNVIVTEDGTLYTCIYAPGFNSDAASREEAFTEYSKMGKYYTYVFESTDSGRTWNYLAQFSCGDEVEGWENLECYCEPKMIEMPDGSLFMLMRTSSNSPMYSTVSHDRGRTWSAPEQFDYCGVLPQLLGLDCGVTVATYGRPDLFMTVTADPTGDTWEEHIEIPLSSDTKNANQKSCFYTSMLQIDENSFWFCYTDFKYPNKNGVPVKSVILRRVTVTMNEE